MYVGDSEDDIMGANRAGLVSVLVDRGDNRREYNQRYTVRSLQEVLLLSQIQGL
jgi:phosphoglycolate phosphatase-like HAD superfamily hydrolase